ncbi:transposase [Roseateles amylovorans]|uniref:Transposase n=1 Tax=Roseateles amylovorans TaxID=2978473 RepID=A0ABY6AWY9_9BURK|nr:transposase [Roseateles amylovorans]UXH77423.1 transposase [Roseateles amylovorans]
MKKRRQRSDVPPDSIQGVSMQTLDKELSRHVEIARTKPVSVDKYGVPWVWIVSHPLWMQADHLKSFVPEGHGLVNLREAIDSTLAYEGLLMNELTRQCTSGLDARMVTRAWLLQVVYSLSDPRRVREGLVYNMLWRWFVGYQLRSEQLPEIEPFVHDLNRVSAHPHVIDIVHRSLNNGAMLHADTEEFRINRGLLHALRTQHVDLPVRLDEPVVGGLSGERGGRSMAR